MSKNERFWTGFSWFFRAFLATTFLLMGLGYLGACGGTADRTNCMEVGCQPDTDAGMMPDSDPANPDGNNTPDGNNPDGSTDVCSPFKQPNPSGMTWNCWGNSFQFECVNPVFVTDSGDCYALCESGLSAGKVKSSDQINDPHSFVTNLPPENDEVACFLQN